jgi:hypothetical protein
VRHRIRDAAERATLHALVAHDEDVGTALLRKADEHVGGVALVGERPAANTLLSEPRLRLRDHLPLLRRGVWAVVGGEQDQLRLEPPRDLGRHLHGLSGRGGPINTDGDGRDH